MYLSLSYHASLAAESNTKSTCCHGKVDLALARQVDELSRLLQVQTCAWAGSPRAVNETPSHSEALHMRCSYISYHQIATCPWARSYLAFPASSSSSLPQASSRAFVPYMKTVSLHCAYHSTENFHVPGPRFLYYLIINLVCIIMSSNYIIRVQRVGMSRTVRKANLVYLLSKYKFSPTQPCFVGGKV